jgi:hypothetical protein
MKKIILLLSVIALTVFTSCEKNEPTLKSATIDTTDIETGYDVFRYELVVTEKTTVYMGDSLGHLQNFIIEEPQLFTYEWRVEKPYWQVYCSIKGAMGSNLEYSLAESHIYKNNVEVGTLGGGFITYISTGGLTSNPNE